MTTSWATRPAAGGGMKVAKGVEPPRSRVRTGRSDNVKGFRMPASHWRGAARRQASEKPRRRKPRGEYAPAAVSVYGDFRRGSARLGRSRTEHWLEWVAGSVMLVGVRAVGPVPAC